MLAMSLPKNNTKKPSKKQISFFLLKDVIPLDHCGFPQVGFEPTISPLLRLKVGGLLCEILKAATARPSKSWFFAAFLLVTQCSAVSQLHSLGHVEHSSTVNPGNISVATCNGILVCHLNVWILVRRVRWSCKSQTS